MADLIVLLHFAFVVFVVLGGLLALRWPRIAWLHVPAVIWGALIEFTGWICPLTPLENRLRRAAGEAGYQGDFIAHYILPALYPDGLTRSDQLVLGGIALALNIAIYTAVIVRHRRAVKKPQAARGVGAPALRGASGRPEQESRGASERRGAGRGAPSTKEDI